MKNEREEIRDGLKLVAFFLTASLLLVAFWFKFTGLW